MTLLQCNAVRYDILVIFIVFHQRTFYNFTTYLTGGFTYSDLGVVDDRLVIICSNCCNIFIMN